MKVGWLALAAILGAGAAVAAEEQDFMVDTAADLATLCSAPAEAATHMAAVHMCHGYLLGVHHMHTTASAAIGGGVYCVPAENPPSRNEFIEDMVVWINARDDADEIEAIDAALLFAAQTFPCP